MIRVMCPNCERTFRTTVEGMGKTAICTGCREPFRIGDTRPPFEWQPSDLGEDSWIGVAPPEAEKEFKHCIICDAPLDEGDISCPECGANQVTGVVHRRKREARAAKETAWSMLPLRPIIIMLVIALVAGGLFWFMHGVAKMASRTAEDLADDAQVGKAASLIRAGETEHEIRRQFANQVTDDNLARIAVPALNAQREDFQQGATWMLASGSFKSIGPLLEAKGAENRMELRRVLRAIGAHRLIELSSQDNPEGRRQAARALCILLQLDDTEELLARLAEPSAPAEKIPLLNEEFRFWPRAVGTFTITVNGQEAPMSAMVEQIGSIFYLTIGTRRFTSADDLPRTFDIPIEQWCAATGTAIDEKALRTIMTGQVNLTSPYGIGWEGTVRLTTKQAIPDGPPGFLPVGTLRFGQRIEVPVVLE